MKVKFTARGGWDNQKEDAKKSLTIGTEYKVKSVIIGKWYTYLKLDVDGRYNHCLFEHNKELEDIIRKGYDDTNTVEVILSI